MMAHEQAINDALARNNTIAFAVDEVREMVMTKAEKTSVDQVRRDLDIECETAAARDVNTNKRIDVIDRELPKKISHRECKELIVEVDTRLAEAIDVVDAAYQEADKKIADELEDQGDFLTKKIDAVKILIPPINVKFDALKTFVDTLPPKIAEGELEDTMQRLSDAKLQIEQVNKMVIKERAKEAAAGNSVEKLAEEIERLKGLHDEINKLHDGRDAFTNEIQDIRDAMLILQKDFRRKTDVLVDADAERAKQTAWLKNQLKLGQEDQEFAKAELDQVKRSMSAIDNTDRIQREVNFCKSEVKRH